MRVPSVSGVYALYEWTLLTAWPSVDPAMIDTSKLTHVLYGYGCFDRFQKLKFLMTYWQLC